MSESNLACPECRTMAKSTDVHCKACGVNLVVAVSLLERKILTSAENRDSILEPYHADGSLMRLGELLVANGDITEAQLQAALARQKTVSAHSWRRTLGQILLEMGAVSREQLNLVSLQQFRQLRETLYISTARRAQKGERATQQLSEVKSILHTLRSSLKEIRAANNALAKAKLNEKQRKVLAASKDASGEMETALKSLGKVGKKTKVKK